MLSHYRLIEKIGEGGMGVVWKAMDTTLEREVAVKLLPETVAQDAGRLARFQREAKLLASLDHPNIATVFGLEQANDFQFLVMELVHGENLDERLGRVRLSLDEVLTLGVQVTDALDNAHANGIIHRDLKPANVMVTRDGKVKVLDFGLAKVFSGPPTLDSDLTTANAEQVTKQGTILGTAAYMSPDHARGRPLDKRADIWSLGCILYETLTGQRAFKEDTISDTIAAILTRDPDWSRIPDGTPTAFRELLRSCLQKDSHARLDDASCARRLLDEAREHLSSRATIPSGDYRAPTERTRRVLLGWRSWAALTALVVGFGLSFVLVLSEWGDRLLHRGGRASIRSLAVLPLENLSGDPEEEYFADGMTEALISNLAKVSQLRVISRTSIMQYKDNRKPMPLIARELNVDAVVEGSVLRSGDRVRVNAQLIRAATDEHLWADSYERDMVDILSLQADVARAVAQEISEGPLPLE
jgi:serine/threonine protein kinase